MILLTLNRCAGNSFCRHMEWKYGVRVKESALLGENKMILELCPEELNLFRTMLHERPDRFENAEGILRMLGN